MAGSSMGKATVSFVGLRVGKNGTTYIPGYNKSGQEINACCRISAFVNGKNNRADVFTLTAWGKLADIMAKSLSPGKEFHCDARPESYDGRVFDGQGGVVLKPDGTPYMTRKVSFRITGGLIFGAESNKQISDEIAAGKRPQDWNVEGSQGQALWKSVLVAKTALAYNGGDKYGYATVHKSNGTTLASQVAGAVDNPNAAQAMAQNVGQMAVDQTALY